MDGCAFDVDVLSGGVSACKSHTVAERRHKLITWHGVHLINGSCHVDMLKVLSIQYVSHAFEIWFEAAALVGTRSERPRAPRANRAGMPSVVMKSRGSKINVARIHEKPPRFLTS